MSTVFIIGAAGHVGRRLIPLLAQQHTQVYALHRSPEQAATLESLGATPVQGDITALDRHQLAALMAPCDAVVFTAGAGGKGGQATTDAVDGQGLVLAVEAAQQAGIQRFVLVSAFPEAGRGGDASENFEHYMFVKKQTEAYLVQTGLDWVILRPGTLTNDAGTGLVSADVALSYGDISRDDVALALYEIIRQPRVRQRIIELTQGDTPVAEAIRDMAG